jgi:hypothetical protein
MSADDLLKFLTSLYPGFLVQWESAGNLHRDGEQFTVSGVCSEFSQYFQNHALPFNAQKAESLFKEIEHYVASNLNDENSVGSALCTCFLENIALSRAGDASVPFMGPASRKFFEHWHVGYRAEA